MEYGFPGGRRAPLDEPPTVIFTLGLGYRATMIIISVIGIILVGCFIGYVIKMREDNVIQAARPPFLFMMSFASIIGISSIFVSSVQPSTVSTCTAVPFMEHFCLFLLLSLIYSKSWRIIKLFSMKTLKIIKITDSQLFSFIGIVMAVVIIIFIVWAIIDPFVPTPYFDSSDPYLIYNVCETKYNIFQAIFYSLEGVLLIVGVVLAIKTRKVSYLQFNESDELAQIIYIISFVAAVILPLTFLIQKDQQNASYLLSSISVWLCSFVTILIIFLSKLSKMKKMSNNSSSNSGVNIPKMYTGTTTSNNTDNTLSDNNSSWTPTLSDNNNNWTPGITTHQNKNTWTDGKLSQNTPL